MLNLCNLFTQWNKESLKYANKESDARKCMCGFTHIDTKALIVGF